MYLSNPDTKTTEQSRKTWPASTLSLNEHPLVWAATLFEPDDLLEIRCIPPKQIQEEQRPRWFLWRTLCRETGFVPWVQAGNIHTAIESLRMFNHLDGVTIPWNIKRKDPASWATAVQTREVQLNIYCSSNPRKHTGDSTNADVPLARSLFVDVEDASPEQVLDRTSAAGLPRPTMTVVSGHGVHPYWRMTCPFTDLTLWATFQRRLIQFFRDKVRLPADKAVHDPARLMRMPGFVNVNWSPALAYIYEADAIRRYEARLFDSLLPQAARNLPSLQQANSKANTQRQNGKLLATTPDSVDRNDILHRALAYQSHWSPADHGKRNSRLFELSTFLVEKFNLNHDELRSVATIYNNRFNQPLDDGEVGQVVENAYNKLHKNGKPRGTFLNQGIEPYQEPEGSVLSLGEWEKQMRTARVESLGYPGSVFSDNSTTGAGKSTADQAAMKVAGSSITFLPTHEACNELADTLNNNGLPAAAYPRVDELTCHRYGDEKHPGDAQLVQLAGLDVGSALCPECPYYSCCEYQQRREEARNAPHAVATHARAAHSRFAPAAGKPVVFIHEDCLGLLRPTKRIAATPSAPGQPHLGHLTEVLDVAGKALDIAKTMDDQEKVAFAVSLFKSTKDLIVRLQDGRLLEEVKAANAAGQLKAVSRVKRLPLKPHLNRPERTDYLLYKAMRALGVNLNGDALRVCLSFACGELESLCLVVDDTFTKGGQREFHQSLVGVWRTKVPHDVPVWFEDATGDCNLLSDLLGRPVVDRTPNGRLEHVVPPAQYPSQDVTMQTSGNVVRGLVRGLLSKHPDAHKVGIITHRVHLPELKKLESYWKDRIHMMDYYRSGNDRASNRWLDCDLLLVLGTPRVPPSAVREGLVRIGRVEDAGKDGFWGAVAWEGRTISGELVEVQGLGYKHPSWAEVHQLLVRNNLVQAVGRGRSVRNGGVPVLVVSNESLAVPLLSEKLEPVKDSVAKTFLALAELSPENATIYIVGKTGVSTAMIAQCTGLSKTQTKEHCGTLLHLGLLARKGARGGWIMAG